MSDVSAEEFCSAKHVKEAEGKKERKNQEIIQLKFEIQKKIFKEEVLSDND